MCSMYHSPVGHWSWFLKLKSIPHVFFFQLLHVVVVNERYYLKTISLENKAYYYVMYR